MEQAPIDSGDNRPEPDHEQQQMPGDEHDEAPDVAATADEAEPRLLEPRIYIASLADYNNGSLHGSWISADQEAGDIHRDIDSMLWASPALQGEGESYGDWAIHDHEGFADYRIDEATDIETVSQLGRGIAEYGPAFAVWADLNDGQPERWDRFAEAFLGHYDNLTAYGEAVFEEAGWQQLITETLPGDIGRYVRIDGEALANDMWLSGEIYSAAAPDGVWIFRTDT